MFFRLAVGIPQLQIVGGPILFNFTSEGHGVQIILRAIPSEDSDYPNPPYSVVCEATAEINPSKTAAPVVDAIWQKILPPGVDLNKLPEVTRKAYVDHEKLIKKLEKYIETVKPPKSKFCLYQIQNTCHAFLSCDRVRLYHWGSYSRFTCSWFPRTSETFITSQRG